MENINCYIKTKGKICNFYEIGQNVVGTLYRRGFHSISEVHNNKLNVELMLISEKRNLNFGKHSVWLSSYDVVYGSKFHSFYTHNKQFGISPNQVILVFYNYQKEE